MPVEGMVTPQKRATIPNPPTRQTLKLVNGVANAKTVGVHVPVFGHRPARSLRAPARQLVAQI